MSSKLILLADRVIGVPLLLEPGKAQVVLQVLQSRIADNLSIEAMDEIDASQVEASDFTGSRRRADGGFSLGRRAGAVGIVSVQGSLVNRGAWVGANSGLMSYEGIAAQLDALRADDEIRSVIMDIDSPGGEATGMFGLAEKVRALNAVKPVTAVVNDIAASAAYGIASGAGQIVISPTSMIGSIGVVLVHLDHSGELEKKGVKATIIHAGANKADGHPFGPLSDAVKSGLQSRVNTLYDRFLEAVSEGRGTRLSADQARQTEANVFIGQEAIDRNLADRVGTFDSVLAELQQEARGGSTTQGSITMSGTNTPAPQAGAETVTKADHDVAVAQASADGATQERARISAIMNCEAAKGRGKAAMALALNSNMDAQGATAVLEATPVEATGAAPIPSIGQRAEGETEMGGGDDKITEPAQAKGGWNDAVSEMNNRA